MKITADLHTHTKYSHGTGTIEQNVKAAIVKGLSAIGISEHGPANIIIGPRLEDFYKMRDEIESLKSRYKKIDILLGCEANIISLDGQIDISDNILKILDYVMVGLHPLVRPLTLKDGYSICLENFYSKISKSRDLRQKVIEQNTAALIKAIRKYNVKVITHPGLHMPIDTAKLARAAAEQGTALEINAGHNYITDEYVKIAKANGAKFVIGSDAHSPAQVGNFKRALLIAERTGLTKKDILNAI